MLAVNRSTRYSSLDEEFYAILNKIMLAINFVEILMLCYNYSRCTI